MVHSTQLFFLLLIAVSAVCGATITLPLATTKVSGLLWWLRFNEVITSCAITGFSSAVICTAGGSADKFAFTVTGGTAGSTGSLAVYINGGAGSVFFDIEFSGSLSVACLHGYVSGSSCVCDAGWQGNDCNTLSNVLMVPLSGGTVNPANWLSGTEAITGCSISGITPNPTCSPAGGGYARQVTVGTVSSATTSGAITIYTNTGGFTIGIHYVNYLTAPCVHGRQLSSTDSSCHCQTGYAGSDCQTIECENGCNRGSCTSPQLSFNLPYCTCNSGWSTDSTYGNCNRKQCNCNGLGSGCTCTGSNCDYTRCPRANYLNGWSGSAVCTMRCSK